MKRGQGFPWPGFEGPADCALRADRHSDTLMDMSHPVSHDRAEETPEAKARWFRSLPLSDRMEIFCSVTDLALEINPRLPDRKDAQQADRGIRILSAA